MKGVIGYVTTNKFSPGVNGFPVDTFVTEESLNFALREVWKSASGQVDLIVVNGRDKRRINEFVGANQRYTPEDRKFAKVIGMYESDYGVCRVALSRWVANGTILLLDSSRVEVMPLAGRSFHYKPLGATGDRESGQVIGEYTLELRNENAHGVITGLTT
jgi:hypothetical protein